MIGLAVCVLLTASLSCSDDGSDPAGAAGADLSPEDAELASEVAGSFFTTTTFPGFPWRPSVTDDDADCIGAGLVSALGAARVREARLHNASWHTLGIALFANFDRAEAEQIVDVFSSCSDTWELLMITSTTQGTELIGDESARCTADKLPDDVARAIFVTDLDRAYDEQPTPDLSHLDPLIAAMEQCLTPDELDRLDWN
jgi:hypothetical protein